MIALLTSLEALLGVITACLPVLKPIYNKIRGTARKNGEGSGVNEILKSGSIPIFMRMSQMFSLTSRKGKFNSADEETLTESPRYYGEKSPGGQVSDESGKVTSVITREISHPMTEKAERVMGIRVYGTPVRRDVDVESFVSRDERGAEGRRET